MREVSIGRLIGVDMRFTSRAVVGFLLLWVVLAIASNVGLGTTTSISIVFGLVAAVLHFAVGVFHHLSHAVAARSTGYPMEAVRLGRFLVLGTSVYPADEPDLPARIHIIRALGGPVGSLLLALAALLAAILQLGSDRLSFWLAAFVFLDSFIVFVGVLIPLGFNDMSTILYWSRRRAKSPQRETVAGQEDGPA